jgi:hypothetical protein
MSNMRKSAKIFPKHLLVEVLGKDTGTSVRMGGKDVGK